jgi:hypothetical protein
VAALDRGEPDGPTEDDAPTDAQGDNGYKQTNTYGMKGHMTVT